MNKSKHIPPVSSTPTASIGQISAKAGSHRSDPLLHDHPWPSMAEFAKLLALPYDTVAPRHAYYRAGHLIHEHVGRDPATLSESEVRDYLLYVKTVKRWKATPTGLSSPRFGPRITMSCPSCSLASRCAIC